VIKYYIRHLDYLMLATVLSISAFGLWIMKNATKNDPGNLYAHQLVYVAIGVVGMFVVAAIPPAWMRRVHWPLYVFVLVSVAAVLAAGHTVNGAARWITFAGFQFQPSEFSKLLLIVGLAALLASRRGITSPGRLTLLALVYIGVPALLVFREPDFGTALVLAAMLMGMLFVYGAPWRHFVWMLLAGAVTLALIFSILPGAGIHVLQSYQVDRITAFLHPDRLDPQQNGYNLNASIVAVAHGGVGGTGVKNATQTLFGYLPEHATDFVFASLAEQRGFFGAGVLLMLYLLVVWRGLKAVAGARDPYSAIVAGGIIFAFLFQIFVNVGMTIGIAPVTGIPLPMVSVGGSSMIANLLAIGVLQAVYVRGRGRTRIAPW
jgi:rod shape determining protein RodA